MTTLKNKILIKPTKKLIFIISILMIIALNLFGAEEEIDFKYYYYTNKIYHSTLKTEIIPSEYVFIETYSDNDYNKNLYLYNLKTKEKKLFYIYKYYDDKEEYYDINGNLTTNWTDKNMSANYFYEITNNRFGETFSFYNRYDKYIENEYIREIISMTKNNNYGNDYIQKAYKYSLTQPEIINEKDRGIYLFKQKDNAGYSELFSTLCFQNEYYNGFEKIEESRLLKYDSKGRVIFNNHYSPHIRFHYTYYSSFGGRKCIYTNSGGRDSSIDKIYFQLNNKSLIKPTWNEFTNNFLNYIKKHPYNQAMDEAIGFYYSKEDTEDNLNLYKKLMEIEFLGFIPIEEFEYYLLAD